MTEQSVTLKAVELLADQTLQACGASAFQASSLAAGVAAAERDGISSHGLVYVPAYCEHLRCWKVIGQAQPEAELPGQRRRRHREKADAEGIVVPSELVVKVEALRG